MGILKLHVWFQGLITKERKNLDPAALPFAKDSGETMGLNEGASLLEVVKDITNLSIETL